MTRSNPAPFASAVSSGPIKATSPKAALEKIVIDYYKHEHPAGLYSAAIFEFAPYFEGFELYQTPVLARFLSSRAVAKEHQDAPAGWTELKKDGLYVDGRRIPKSHQRWMSDDRRTFDDFLFDDIPSRKNFDQILNQILQDSTRVYRKGKAVERKQVGDIDVTELFGYKHTSKAPAGKNYDKVDMIFVDVVVDRAKAEQYRHDFTLIVGDYLRQSFLDSYMHAGGLSYTKLASELEQEGALRLMALGKTLRMWNVVSSKTSGMDDVMITKIDK